ncbi:MAG TPA: LLM class flavin-dependent oxidoreductase [Pyrinomonadaceae bacterium]|nr:LLM class flavin-dependent oxidoreductase [Pyrinomonadaceae bacterium]
MTATPPIRLSVLDLSPVAAGSSAPEALRNTLDLAQLADQLGYTRYWLAEHHNTALIAISSPEIMIGHVAGVTKRIRVGSGGVMLPNHAPLKVAETFRTLEALHPGRIDLGIGRAPGTDYMTALALRRSREALGADDFPEQLAELLAFLSGEFPANHPFRRIRAIPEGVGTPEIWLLGSSDFSARLAAELGLSFAFAHHIHPRPAVPALKLYQERFHPSAYLSAPASMLATSVICAETDEEANELARPADLTLLRFAQGRFGGQIPSVAEASAYPYSVDEMEVVNANRERLLVGSPERVREQLSRLATQTGVGEIMLTTMTHDHSARRRSYELLAKAFSLSPIRESDAASDE